nr:MAG TPA: hypothetical protein [Caudoviricetes sp.]
MHVCIYRGIRECASLLASIWRKCMTHKEK